MMQNPVQPNLAPVEVCKFVEVLKKLDLWRGNEMKAGKMDDQ